jgi:predicted DNA-binding ribbon-helix-helix protein
MRSAIAKRSVVLGGHKTSVSLESEFWQALRDIADRQSVNVSKLVQKIDGARGDGNLSSAVRVFVLDHFRTLVAGDEEAPLVDGPRPAMQQALWPENA